MSQESVTLESRWPKELLAKLGQDQEKNADLRDQIKTVLGAALLR